MQSAPPSCSARWPFCRPPTPRTRRGSTPSRSRRSRRITSLTRGKDAPHIVSIVLEQDSLLRGTNSWVVSWSRPMMLEGDKEIGMRIRLDGSVTHIVENKSGPTKRRAPVKF